MWNGAFVNCDSLERIIVFDRDTEIDESAFDSHTVIIAYSNSCAAKCADKPFSLVKFVPLEEYKE